MERDVFDAVICMWLTFNELLSEPEQIRALQELARVVRPGGWALIDGPPYLEAEEAAAPEQPNEVTVSPAATHEDLDQTPVGRRYAALMEAIAVARRTGLVPLIEQDLIDHTTDNDARIVSAAVAADPYRGFGAGTNEEDGPPSGDRLFFLPHVLRPQVVMEKQP